MAVNQVSSQGIRLVLIAGMLLYALGPSLKVGFVSDDATRSLREGFQSVGSLDRLEYLSGLHGELLHGAGRFMPVHFLLYTTTWVSSVTAHRALSLVLVLLAIALTCLLVKRMFDSIDLAIGMAALLPILIQLRAYHDPILAFGGFLPGVTILNVGSLLLLEWAVRDRRWAGFVVSALAYLLALWSYEVSYFLLPIHVLIAFRGRFSTNVRFWGPLIVALGLAIGTAVYGRQSGTGAYVGTQVGGLGAPFWRALVAQLSGALPFSYTWAAPRATRDAIPSVATGLFFLLGYAAVFRRAAETTVKDFRGVLLVAAVLVIGPALPIAVSAKYQHELRLGLAYLPVFVSLLGVALAGATLIAWLRPNAPIRAALTSVAALAASWTHAENTVTCDRVATVFERPRSLEAKALERGILQGAPAGVGLIVEFGQDFEELQPGWSWYSWDQPAFFKMHARLMPAWVLAGGLVRTPDRAEVTWSRGWWEAASKGPMYYLRYEALPLGGGWVMAAAVARDTTESGFHTAGPARVYWEAPDETWRLQTIEQPDLDPREIAWPPSVNSEAPGP